MMYAVMFRFKPASQFVERCHSLMSYALNMEDLISNSLYNKDILTYFSLHFTNQLNDFCTTYILEY
jgi:hypothetical protein